MNRRVWLEQTLRAAFEPDHLEVIDDSARHAGHAGARPGGNSHFQVVIVSNHFSGQSRIERHRAVYTALGDAMKADVHALAIRALTPDEWGPGPKSQRGP